MKTPAIVLLLAAYAVVPRAVAAQTATDVLNVGLAVTGKAQMERGKDDTTFTITMGGTRAVLLVLNEHAFSPQPNTTVTYQWSQALARPANFALQVGEPRGRPADTLREFNEMLACFSEPRESQGTE